MGEIIEWPTDQQLVLCWTKIESLQPGQILIIKEHAPSKPKLFIQSCKMWIDCYKYASFNDDYSELIKIENIN